MSHKYIKYTNTFDREGSTLAVMDDLQFVVHTYDGCGKGCPGCLVDKHFKNKKRFQGILSDTQLDTINFRVQEYYTWVKENINTKKSGYFHTGGHQVNHHSYTMRFGNHGELPYEELKNIATRLKSEYYVWSVAPVAIEQLDKFVKLKEEVPGNYFLEIIYDPCIDDPQFIADMIKFMDDNGFKGYPEVLITRKLLNMYSGKEFVHKCLLPFGHTGTQLQLGRYSPSKTRNFIQTQMVPLDEEVEWMAEMSREILKLNLEIHPIPIAEYAVTLLDDYEEINYLTESGDVKVKELPPLDFDINIVKELTRDIFITSLYIDHNLDLYLWSESMGQHVLDNNLGFSPLGNIQDKEISEILFEEGNKVEVLLNDSIKDLLVNPKCSPCRYKSFCASHAITLFRNWHKDNGKHCYGYLPVIREFQKNKAFLDHMIQGFKDLNF